MPRTFTDPAAATRAGRKSAALRLASAIEQKLGRLSQLGGYLPPARGEHLAGELQSAAARLLQDEEK